MKYDYLILGAGSAGSIVAARLSEDHFDRFGKTRKSGSMELLKLLSAPLRT